MIEISEGNPENEIRAFVHAWFRLLSEGRFSEAVELIDEANCYGIVWTGDMIKNLIEIDTFGPESRFAKAHPEGIVYSDPDAVPSPEREISSLVPLQDGTGYSYDHDVPLNGEWSDLTAQFEFKRTGSGYSVVLHDLHVL